MSRLTVLLPVTRPWTLVGFVDAIHESSIPRDDILLYIDGPDCGEWPDAMKQLGFDVTVAHGYSTPPPSGRESRRARHMLMRRMTQELVPDGLLLCLEDDSIVPPDVWERLTAIGPTATGVQRSRYDRSVGIWRDGELVTPRGYGSGTEKVQACGLYCLLTTGEDYRQPFGSDARFGGAIDAAQTVHMRPTVDWDLIVGHLTETELLMPIQRIQHASGASMLVEVEAPPRVAGQSERFDMSTGERIVAPMQRTFRTHARVVRDGFVQCGSKQLILLTQAVAWGLADENGEPLLSADYEGRTTPGVPYIPEGLELHADPVPPELKDVPDVSFRAVPATPIAAGDEVADKPDESIVPPKPKPTPAPAKATKKQKGKGKSKGKGGA